MFWDKKEDKKGLPELPPLKFPNMPPEESREEEDMGSQSPINAAESEELPELPAKFSIPRIREMEEPIRPMTLEAKSSAKTEDVYVKIERFHSARKALNSARNKLKEMDELMRKIRETKMREEQELASWEKEIETIKSKVEDVTNNIFEKVE